MGEELYRQICQMDSLAAAWLKVKEKGSAGGIDKITVVTFESALDKNLRDLSEELRSYHYIPEPYQEIKIPKDNHEFRSLSLPSIRDKVVQQAVKSVIEPLLEKEFLDVSYAYRPGKGAVKAIHRVNHLIKSEGREWVTLCDIDCYFDSVPHDRLLKMLSQRIKDDKLVTIISLWIRMGKVDSHIKWQDVTKGIPQGGVISPLLANLYLHPFDKFMLDKRFGYVRYADDFVILSHSEGEAQRALKDIKWFLSKQLALSLNPDNRVGKIQESFEFLGITFNDAGETISNDKMAELRDKVNRAIQFDRTKDLGALIETVEGIKRYYGQILSQDILEKLDGWTEECLKSRIKEVYNKGVFANKGEIKSILLPLTFLSTKYQMFQTRTIKGIIAYCRRSRKKEVATEPSNIQKDPIRKRKREYQRLESESFELLITRPGMFIGKTLRGIVVKERGVKKHEAPLQNLRSISILSTGVTISSNVIHFCAEKSIPITLMGYDGKPYAKVYAFHSSSASLGIAQLKAFENGKAQLLAKTFVSGKIRNQANLAKYWNKYRKGKDEDFSVAFSEKLSLIESLALEAKNIDEKDITILRGKLLSVEGRAASCYWDLVEKLLNDDVEFEGRVRKGAKDLVNSILNYGYGILYSRLWDAILRADLNPYISYLHTSQDGKPSLSFDLIEEFRQQAVDRAVFSLITKGEELKMENGLLNEETRRRVAEKVLERINVVETFRGRKTRLSEIMIGQAKTLANFLQDKEKNYRPYIGKW